MALPLLLARGTPVAKAHVAMKSRIALIVALCFLTSSCAARRFPRRPQLPAQIVGKDEAQKIFEAYKLICQNAECKRADGTYDLEASFPLAAGYGEPSSIVSDYNNTLWAVYGIGTALLILSLMTGFMWTSEAENYRGTDRYSDYKAMGTEAYLVGAGIAVGTILIGGILPMPGENFGAAYNDALEKDVATRTSTRS